MAIKKLKHKGTEIVHEYEESTIRDIHGCECILVKSTAIELCQTKECHEDELTTNFKILSINEEIKLLGIEMDYKNQIKRGRIQGIKLW